MVCGVVSVVGINFDGCGLLLVVASDGYLAVICSVDWDLAVILKFSVIKFVRMLRKCKKFVRKYYFQNRTKHMKIFSTTIFIMQPNT